MTVRTADRTLDIFESFARRQRPITVSDLARELSLPTSTCFALVHTLVDRGFLYHLRPARSVLSDAAAEPGRRCDRPSRSRSRRTSARFSRRCATRRARPSSSASCRDWASSISRSSSSRHAVRYTMTVGWSARCTLPRSARRSCPRWTTSHARRVLSQLKYPKLTERTIRSRTQYVKSLDDGHKRGYWTNVGESSPDVMGIALPVRIFGDLYGINLVGPQSRFDRNLKSVCRCPEGPRSARSVPSERRCTTTSGQAPDEKETVHACFPVWDDPVGPEPCPAPDAGRAERHGPRPEGRRYPAQPARRYTAQPIATEEITVSVAVPFMAVFNNLVIYDQSVTRNTFESIRPELATAWTVSDDGLAVRFDLRQGVKWHDGKAFTAADVRCTFDMLMEKGEVKLPPQSARRLVRERREGHGRQRLRRSPSISRRRNRPCWRSSRRAGRRSIPATCRRRRCGGIRSAPVRSSSSS